MDQSFEAIKANGLCIVLLLIFEFGLCGRDVFFFFFFFFKYTDNLSV